MYRVYCETSDNVCLDLRKCCYSIYIYYIHTIFRFILSTGNSEFLLYTHSLSLHVYYCFLYRLFGVPVEYDEYGHRPPEDGDDNENMDDGMLLKYLQSLSKIYDSF